VCGSANQLQQVLVNLIQNAFDAIEKTLQPRLELEHHPSGTQRGTATATMAAASAKKPCR
jgi:C4-dicarboxylate-specific signal transduction histidine kinase